MNANGKANPITINIYPELTGTKEPISYNMYLDDGISRSSASSSAYLGGNRNLGEGV
jgi:hypothetical protein